MEMFKFNKKEIENLCRDLKTKINRNIRTKGCYQYPIMYNVNEECFYMCEVNEVEKLEANGNLLYCTFSHYSVDGKVTIKWLKDKIFRM